MKTEYIEMDPLADTAEIGDVKVGIGSNGLDAMQLKGTYFNCQICNGTFTSRMKMIVHYIFNHQLVCCNYCTTVFRNEEDKMIHINQWHSLPECINCNEVCANFEQLQEHYLEMHNLKLCDYCRQTVEPVENYDKHLEIIHSFQIGRQLGIVDEIFEIKDRSRLGNVNYSCLICNPKKKLSKLSGFHGHYIYHHAMSLQTVVAYALKYANFIDVCGATGEPIESKINLNENQISSDVCNTCGNKFTDDTPKLSHDIFCKGFLYCVECENCFSDPETFAQHTSTEHTEIPCKFGCGIKFKLDEFSTHIQQIHDFVECNLCDLITSSTRAKLNTHLMKNHNVIDVTIYESHSNKLYRLEVERNDTGNQMTKVLCNFCNIDITMAMYDLCNLICHYESQHHVNKKSLLKKLGKNPMQFEEIVPSDLDPASDDDFDYAKFFTIVNQTETMTKDMHGIGEFNYDTSMIDCIGSDTSDDSGDDELRTFNFCNFCNRRLTPNESTYRHLNNKHGFLLTNNGITCRSCRKQFSSAKSRRQHIKNIHRPQDGDLRCLFCNFSANLKKVLRKHLKEQHLNEIETVSCDNNFIGYPCRYCEITKCFWTIAQRNDHEIQDHATETYMMCPICKKTFSSKTCFRKHTLTEHIIDALEEEEHIPMQKIIFYKCIECKLTYRSLLKISDHMKTNHPKNVSLFCKIKSCKMKCEDQTVLAEHVNLTHCDKTLTTYRCKSCGDTFLRSIQAKKHYKLRHTIVNQPYVGYRCRLCTKVFKNADDRKLHLLTEHKGDRPYECKECNKTFSTRSSLHSHSDTHRSIPFDCDVCKKSFCRRDTLYEHMQIHKGSRFQCAYCPKTFVQHSNCLRHERSHTGVTPYICTVCNKKFRDGSSFKKHANVHTGELTVQCPVCDRIMSTKTKLKLHLRKHEKADQKMCQHCNKMFVSYVQLNEHIREKHDGIFTEHVCPHCKKSMRNASSLRKHLKLNKCTTQKKCNHCDHKCSNDKSMEKHLMKLHQINKNEISLEEYESHTSHANIMYDVQPSTSSVCMETEPISDDQIEYIGDDFDTSDTE